MARIKQLGGAAGGAGVTLGLRQYLDQPGSTALTRPSVLHGVGVGAVMLGASMAAEARMIDPIGLRREDFVNTTFSYGVGSLSTGAFSALFPRGSTGAQLPSLS
jgi:hypothetical protein